MTIEEVLARGREAFDGYIRKRHKLESAPGEHVAIVTHADFLANTAACLDYVADQRPLYILLDDGAIYALLCRHHPAR